MISSPSVDDLRGDARADLFRYIRHKAAASNTYVVSLLVGTLINAYGHLLVPWMRGSEQPLDHFMTELFAYPVTVTISVVLAYVFPYFVGLYSSVATRYAFRHFEYRAAFPDAKPDPVFRAHPDGTIIDLGQRTQELFAEHGIRRGQDFTGDLIWKRLADAHDRGEASASVSFNQPATKSWYVVSHSPGPGGSINVYAAQTDGPTRREGDGPEADVNGSAAA